MLSKTTVTFGFGKGLALKDSVNLIPMGKFLSLQNCVFDVLGQLTKRNGFGTLTSTLGSVSYLTTYQNNLIGLGSSIQSYSGAVNSFVNKGAYPNVQLSTVPLSNLLFSQYYSDLAIANNGVMCQVAANSNGGGLGVTTWSWTILEQSTGQLISGPNQIVSSGGPQCYSPRVFAVGSQFTVLYDAQIPGTVNSLSWLEYVTIPTGGPFGSSSVSMVSSSCLLASGQSFDGAVASNSGLFLSWIGQSAINSALLNPVTRAVPPIRRQATTTVNVLSVAADYTTTPFTMWTGTAKRGVNGHAIFSASNVIGSVTQVSPFVTGSGTVVINSTSFEIANLTMTAQNNGSMTAYVEVINTYSYDNSLQANLIYTQQMNALTCSANFAIASTTVVIARGLGLSSKGFIVNSSSYVLSQWLSPYQSTYFLINSTGQVQAKIAYGNANNTLVPALNPDAANNLAYSPNGIPSVSVIGSSAFFPYLVQTTVQAVGTGTNVGSQSTGIYGKLGTNMASVNFSPQIVTPKEIGQNLILGGGFLGAYDGKQFVENDFFLFPDSVEVLGSGSAILGSLTPQAYFYQAIYEWVDNKGNIYRSAPSVPVQVTLSSGTAVNSIKIPMLRTSYKNYPYGGQNTPAQIKLFRWSTAQPIYYLTANYLPQSSDVNTDSTTFIDSRADSAIIGGEILYTNGGIVEDTNGPATKAMTTFDSRLWLIDAEDQNLLWFSKQVIENTPVEMSDLLTFYVAPNVGAEGPTGVMNCLAPMDDKLIIFKDSALYYINGRGPDNTGAQNQYSDPIFITTAVGCANQNSIVLIPNGLMFQSSKGIWLLGRDLSTQYIGKDVETLVNTNQVLSAITIPNTNQVRFTLNTGVVLLYDYFVGEWGTFNGIPGISSSLYNGLHTYVNSSSSVRQETPGVYSDGTNPVLMSFTTGWIGLYGLQGYQRAYKSYLLGTYYTPHNFTVGLSYDYNSQITQTITVNPTNTVGSGSQVEQWQLNFINQSCQSFQLTFNEVASQSAGQGLTISGLDLVYGQIKGYPRNISSKNQKS